jgi:hypothetical protein
MSIKLAVNISFLFKEKPFLERFEAAVSAGRPLLPHVLNEIMWCVDMFHRSLFYGFIGIGFKAVEWGAEIPDQYSLQDLVAAREKAGVSVIGLCTPAGMLFVTALI